MTKHPVIRKADTDLHKGDIFNVINRNPFLQKVIGWQQRRLSEDGQSTYGHSGLIIDESGYTFESGIKSLSGSYVHGTQLLWRAYSGLPCQIIRYRGVHDDAFRDAFAPIFSTLNGAPYPIWRLPLFLFGPKFVRRWTMTGLGVCSETVAKVYCNEYPMVDRTGFKVRRSHHQGLGSLRWWAGVYPDWLADLAHPKYGRKRWIVVAEGVIE